MSNPSEEALAAVERIDNTPGWIMDNERWRRDVVRIIDEELEPLRRENRELREALQKIDATNGMIGGVSDMFFEVKQIARAALQSPTEEVSTPPTQSPSEGE